MPGDLTWTRLGWKPVTAAWCSRRNAEVITVALSDGRELTGTGDHRIWTENDGWKRLDALVWGDILSGWKNPLLTWYSRVTSTIATRTASAAVTGSTTSTTRPGKSVTCTATYGLPRIRATKSRKAGIFTIRTRTRSITTRPTWFSSRLPTITSSIRATSPGRKRTSWRTLTGSGLSLPSGTAPKRAGRGTSEHGKRHLGSAAAAARLRPCESAAPSSRPWWDKPAPRLRTATALAAASNRARDKKPKYLETVTCPACGDEFQRDKYRKKRPETCGRKCAWVMRKRRAA